MIGTLGGLQLWIKPTCDFCSRRTVCFFCDRQVVFFESWEISFACSRLKTRYYSTEDTNIWFFGLTKFMSDEHELESGLALFAVKILLAFWVLSFFLSLCILMCVCFYARACDCDCPEVHLSVFLRVLLCSQISSPSCHSFFRDFPQLQPPQNLIFQRKETCGQFMFSRNNAEIVPLCYLYFC